ncbi:protein of unknown function [Nitrospira japonica]|uniref:PRC-barrel domain-containing protein n=1 Tax=Nitrospira japonica TaxID=1325564 RepID=A0A1W1IA68_9BACT|nr:protein of unknown function [Nitrospira japonica]
MSIENWTVQTTNGQNWGYIKRLILDSDTREISHADVILAKTGRLIRLPWRSFEVRDGWIKLRISERPVRSRRQSHLSSREG